MPYIETNLENIINIKKNLIVFHDYNKNPDFSFGVESHDFWEFEYITHGSFKICHGDKSYLMKAGDIIFHKPNQPHESLGIESQGPIAYANISFVCNSPAMKCFEDYHAPLSEKSKKLVEELIEEGVSTFDAVADGPVARSVVKSTAPIGGQQAYRLKLELFLINLIREINEQNPEEVFTSRKDFDNNLFERISKYLADNIYSSISLDDMQNKFSYSKAFLCKFFKKKSGLTIVSYYNDLKIKESAELLKDRSYSVAQVSEKLNFTSRYYFAKAFKKVMGMSPSEYRKGI